MRCSKLQARPPTLPPKSASRIPLPCLCETAHARPRRLNCRVLPARAPHALPLTAQLAQVAQPLDVDGGTGADGLDRPRRQQRIKPRLAGEAEQVERPAVLLREPGLDGLVALAVDRDVAHHAGAGEVVAAGVGRPIVA